MISSWYWWFQSSKKFSVPFWTRLEIIFVSEFIFLTFAHMLFFILHIMIDSNDFSPILDLFPNYHHLQIHFIHFCSLFARLFVSVHCFVYSCHAKLRLEYVSSRSVSKKTWQLDSTLSNG